MGLLIKLFFAFFKIGLLAFGGGYAVLPLINEVIIVENAWLSVSEMTDVVSISQMTPGPIAINAASFVGTKIRGIKGAIIATVGNVIPQLIIMLSLSYFIFRGSQMKIFNRALKLLRPGVVGLILSAALAMIIVSIFPDGISLMKIDYIALIGFVVGFILILKKVDNVIQILAGALLGIILSFIF